MSDRERRGRAQRALGGNRADALSAGGRHGCDVDEPQAERALGEEPGLVALQPVGRKLRGASVPGQRTSIRCAYAVSATSASIFIDDSRFGRGEQPPCRGDVALRRRRSQTRRRPRPAPSTAVRAPSRSKRRAPPLRRVRGPRPHPSQGNTLREPAQPPGRSSAQAAPAAAIRSEAAPGGGGADRQRGRGKAHLIRL